MMTINIICVGNLKEKFWSEACLEYQKRLRSFCRFNIIEVDEYRLPDSPGDSLIQLALDEEAKCIIKKLEKNAKTIAMCIEGGHLSSEELSARINKFSVEGTSCINFIIGGSWGLSGQIKQMADGKMSMSKMTFPHQLARVMLCEQIYRAFQISGGGKYHK